jgi:hypothetical protein
VTSIFLACDSLDLQEETTNLRAHVLLRQRTMRKADKRSCAGLTLGKIVVTEKMTENLLGKNRSVNSV